MTMSIYANVRPGSKYGGQRTDKPFAVSFDCWGDDYFWCGGPGGRYRTEDLCFFYMTDSQFYKLDLCQLSSIPQLIATKVEVLGGIGDGWAAEYWATVADIARTILVAAENECSVAGEREREYE